VAPDRGGWVAFHADGPGTIETPTGSLNAHTNPVYVEVNGVAPRSAEEARAFLKWIDQFEILLRSRNRIPTEKLRQQAQEQIEAAPRVRPDHSRGEVSSAQLLPCSGPGRAVESRPSTTPGERLMDRRRFLALPLLGALHNLLPAAGPDAASWQASGKHGAVAGGGTEAVEAGITTLRAGGNAADAAAATILALSVTDSKSFCFGGEVPILVYAARRKVVEVLAGMGAAPRLATREHFAKDGIPGSGIEAAAVPAAPDACLTLLDRHGTRTFSQVAEPALRLLDRGKEEWHADLASTLRRLVVAEKASPGDRRRGLRLVADCFYRGPVARAIDEWSRDRGGLLRYTDLATHVTRVEEPASVEYRGYTVCKCGPWTQGPCLLEALGLLEGFDLRVMGHNRPDAIHVTVEAMKLALADRDVYYADPLFADVPRRNCCHRSTPSCGGP
jgi:hypothetical protein